MAITDKVFIYCERGLDPSFWAEPLNAVSNAGYLFAALAGAVALVRRPGARPDGLAILLVSLVAAIAAGSFLFHTFAERWSGLADVLPIVLFMHVYLFAALRRFLGLPWLPSLGWVAAFFVTMALVQRFRCGGAPCLNGSLGYLPALAALVIVGGMLARRAQPAARGLLAAAAVFAVSITFRSLDLVLCDATRVFGRALGTHVLWHLLNAIVLHLLLQALIRSGLTEPSALLARMPHRRR